MGRPPRMRDFRPTPRPEPEPEILKPEPSDAPKVAEALLKTWIVFRGAKA